MESSHLRRRVEANHLENYDEIKKKFFELFDHGRGDPELIFNKFKQLHSIVRFCIAPTVEEIISRLKNRSVLFEFYRFCFDDDAFGKFERDDRMRRNLEQEGFQIVYKNHEPYKVIDMRSSNPDPDSVA